MNEELIIITAKQRSPLPIPRDSLPRSSHQAFYKMHSIGLLMRSYSVHKILTFVGSRRDDCISYYLDLVNTY